MQTAGLFLWFLSVGWFRWNDDSEATAAETACGVTGILHMHLRTGIFEVAIDEQQFMTGYFRTATPAISVTVFGSARSIIFTSTD